MLFRIERLGFRAEDKLWVQGIKFRVRSLGEALKNAEVLLGSYGRVRVSARERYLDPNMCRLMAALNPLVVASGQLLSLSTFWSPWNTRLKHQCNPAR